MDRAWQKSRNLRRHRTRRDGKKFVRSEANYRTIESVKSLIRGQMGLLFHTTHVKFVEMRTRRESASLN